MRPLDEVQAMQPEDLKDADAFDVVMFPTPASGKASTDTAATVAQSGYLEFLVRMHAPIAF